LLFLVVFCFIHHKDGTDWLWILAVTGALAATFAQLSSGWEEKEKLLALLSQFFCSFAKAIMSFSRVIWAASKSTGKYKHYPTFIRFCFSLFPHSC
jgi:hypothetical protein